VDDSVALLLVDASADELVVDETTELLVSMLLVNEGDADDVSETVELYSLELIGAEELVATLSDAGAEDVNESTELTMRLSEGGADELSQRALLLAGDSDADAVTEETKLLALELSGALEVVEKTS
jgi:hypothetical protein